MGSAGEVLGLAGPGLQQTCQRSFSALFLEQPLEPYSPASTPAQPFPSPEPIFSLLAAVLVEGVRV